MRRAPLVLGRAIVGLPALVALAACGATAAKSDHARTAIRSDHVAVRPAAAPAAPAPPPPRRTQAAPAQTPDPDPLSVAPVRQRLRDDCEATALSMLLATRGIHRGQLQLQSDLPHALPRDPQQGTDGAEIWGDPELGFVGRAHGGGPGGGFGVYEGPVLQLARRWVSPVDLSGDPVTRLYRRLRAGHAVMAWVGLADGPYRSWRTPQGREVTVNFSEHTILLVAERGDELLADDPLTGARETIAKPAFEVMWQRLGRRAISV